VTDLIFLMVS